MSSLNPHWGYLESEDQLNSYLHASHDHPVVFFKHSTRCSISGTALNRINQKLNGESSVQFVYLDLLRFRALSNLIVERLQVEHESPQALKVVNGRCVYHTSHLGIHYEELI